MAAGIVLALLGAFVLGHLVWGDWAARVVEAVA